MEYKIGEVSKMLNISKEMIRYYEKKGALTPTRTSDNNYRTYSTMDVFLLMEIIRYQSFEFGIKDISVLLKDDYMKKYSEHLHHLYKRIDKEINQKMIYRQRIKELEERARTSQYNVGNYWIKEIEEHDLVFLVDSKGDQYNRINISPHNQSILFSDNNMAYFESIVIFDENIDHWYYGINTDYNKVLNLNAKFERKLDKRICLCTMVDMGEVGEFNRNCLNPIFDEIKNKGYKIIGVPQAMIVCRGYQNSRFERILEIQIPIEL